MEDRLAAEQSQLAQTGTAHMSLRSQFDSLRARSEQRSARMQQLAAELAELESALEVANAGNRSTRGRLEEAIEAMAGLEERRKELEADRESLRQRLTEARGLAEEHRNAAREVAIRVESRRASHESLLAGIARLDGQMAQFPRVARTSRRSSRRAKRPRTGSGRRSNRRCRCGSQWRKSWPALAAQWRRWTPTCGSSTNDAWAPRPPCRRPATCSRT